MKLLDGHTALLKEQGGQGNVDSMFIFDILAIPSLPRRLGAAFNLFVTKFPLEVVLILVNTSLPTWLKQFSVENNKITPPVHCAATLLAFSAPRLPKMQVPFVVLLLFALLVRHSAGSNKHFSLSSSSC